MSLHRFLNKLFTHVFNARVRIIRNKFSFCGFIRCCESFTNLTEFLSSTFIQYVSERFLAFTH